MFTGKNLGTLLIVSLMVNAFLAGGLVTHFLRAHRGAPHHHRPDFTANEGHDRRGPGGDRFERRGPVEGKLLRDVVHALGGPRDPRVRATLMPGHPERAAQRRGMERTEAAVRSALSAEPYEEARLTAALAELSRAAGTRQREAQETLVQLGRQLSAEERSKLRGAPTGPKSPDLAGRAASRPLQGCDSLGPATLGTMATAEVLAKSEGTLEELARGPVLLFDGECGVCATSVQWVLAHERGEGLRFASLQSPAGRAFFGASGLPEHVDSLIWLERDGSALRVDYYADAVRSVLRYVGGPWRPLLIALGLVPRALRDLGYRVFARHRLSVAAKQCLIPKPAQKARFFEDRAEPAQA